jgi:hypothetical protein
MTAAPSAARWALSSARARAGGEAKSSRSGADAGLGDEFHEFLGRFPFKGSMDRIFGKSCSLLLSPETDRAAIINELIALFDGPSQREAQRLEAQALAEAWHEHSPDVWPQVTL